MEKQEEKTKFQDIEKLIETLIKTSSEGSSMKWIDLAAYTQNTMQRHNKHQAHALNTEVSEVHYLKGNVKILPKKYQDRKKLKTRVTNHHEESTAQTLTFTESLTRTLSHTMTVRLSLTVSLKATAGFLEASLETSLNLVFTDTFQREKAFSFNPKTVVHVKAQREARIVAYLYPIPEIHPFEEEVKVTGEVPIRFKYAVDYDDKTRQFKKLMTGKDLWFIPIVHIFEEMKKKQVATGIDFEINNNAVVFKAQGETEVTNYVAEIEVSEQVPLPSWSVTTHHSKGSASSENRAYETKVLVVRYANNSEVTFDRVTSRFQDVNHLCQVITAIGEGLKTGLSGLSEDFEQAINQASETYLKDLKQTHTQERAILQQDPARIISNKRHFTGATQTFFSLYAISRTNLGKIEPGKRTLQSSDMPKVPKPGDN